jgi:hypothetical protein
VEDPEQLARSDVVALTAEGGRGGKMRRWHRIADDLDPGTAVDLPGFPPATQIASEVQAVLTAPTL